MSIQPPRLPEGHPDRSIECQFQIEPLFQAIVHKALAAGWTEDDVSAALLDLARNHIRGIIADRKTQADIGEAQGA
ncbi:hypothetical protein [Aureimonas glaciei]|uniref:Uncharacterized protein n=1 Tax=Aureimonas glaciei TaxID=1776957 RepID=A0A917DE06_9HYPH|nr:hypothetical protein [Aureimonas glaciei]GGD30619.1 hypothetical protein GCM10011335_37090 [Aureimonas glaciei]